MFSSKEQLERKTGRFGTPRFNYLQTLVSEFQATEAEEAKLQILANLANFAYDPINYETMRQLNILELFIDNLTEENSLLIEFAIGGICNCCLDRKNAALMIEVGGLPDIVRCISSKNVDTVLSAVTTLIYLLYSAPETRTSIMTAEVLELMRRYSQSANIKIRNLALVFLAHQDVSRQHDLESGSSIEFIVHNPAAIPGPPPAIPVQTQSTNIQDTYSPFAPSES